MADWALILDIVDEMSAARSALDGSIYSSGLRHICQGNDALLGAGSPVFLKIVGAFVCSTVQYVIFHEPVKDIPGIIIIIIASFPKRTEGRLSQISTISTISTSEMRHVCSIIWSIFNATRRPKHTYKD